jgi:hypothetical protein
MDWLGIDLRVTDDLLKGTVFVGFENPSGFVPLGTGFLGAIRHKDLQIPCMVTARHVVDLVPKGKELLVRVNRKSGDCATIPLVRDHGLIHWVAANDIAVYFIPLDFAIYDYKLHYLNRDVIVNERNNVWNPGIGDEVSIIGLYLSHYGNVKNVPIVRVGNIALMPGEPVQTDVGYVQAYLVETRSIAGLSGSLVLVQPPRIRIEGEFIAHLPSPPNLLLGMLIGYHLLGSATDQIPVAQTIENERLDWAPSPNMEAVNTGIGVVIPIERVLEIIEQPALQPHLDATAETFYASGKYVRSSSSI